MVIPSAYSARLIDQAPAPQNDSRGFARSRLLICLTNDRIALFFKTTNRGS
jgi:hypothetical protein